MKNLEKNKIIPVILSGGSGSRLWPLSRASFPKQYISLTQDSNKSMLQLTLDTHDRKKTLLMFPQ